MKCGRYDRRCRFLSCLRRKVRPHLGHAGRGVFVGNCGGSCTRVLSPSKWVGRCASNVYAMLGLAVAMDDSARTHLFLLPHILHIILLELRERYEIGVKGLALDRLQKARLWYISQARKVG